MGFVKQQLWALLPFLSLATAIPTASSTSSDSTCTSTASLTSSSTSSTATASASGITFASIYQLTSQAASATGDFCASATPAATNVFVPVSPEPRTFDTPQPAGCHVFDQPMSAFVMDKSYPSLEIQLFAALQCTDNGDAAAASETDYDESYAFHRANETGCVESQKFGATGTQAKNGDLYFFQSMRVVEMNESIEEDA